MLTVLEKHFILNISKRKRNNNNLIKMDLAEINFDIGNQKEVKISLQNILKIFKHFLQ